MIPELRRRLASEGLIGLAVALGIHFMFVDPQKTTLGELQKRCDELTAKLPSQAGMADAVPAALTQMERARAEAERLERAGELARRESELFSRIMRLASDHRVRVDRMEPQRLTPASFATGGGTPASPLAPGTPGATLTLRPRDASVGYSIALSATYADLCRFLSMMQTELAYAHVRSLRVQALDGPVSEADSKLVTAVIETSHFAVDASPLPLPDAANGGQP
ncbi:MAG: hypothetical protein AB7G11_04985 [Phycisphaerales bacterium]